MIDSFERNALFRIPSVCLQALCRKSYDAWALILYYNALEWKRKVFTDLESGAAFRAARYVCGAVLVYDGHLAPKVQADGSFDFATPVEELFK